MAQWTGVPVSLLAASKFAPRLTSSSNLSSAPARAANQGFQLNGTTLSVSPRAQLRRKAVLFQFRLTIPYYRSNYQSPRELENISNLATRPRTTLHGYTSF